MQKRLLQHNSGKGAKYTRGRGPCRVVYMEQHATKQAALKREYEIKRYARKRKIELISTQLKEVYQHANSEELS